MNIWKVFKIHKKIEKIIRFNIEDKKGIDTFWRK